MNLKFNIESIEVYLLIDALVSITARRLRLPYAVGLLMAGVAVAFSPWKPNISVTKELVFILFLPPLVFEAAFLIRWAELKRDLGPLLGMATLGVLLSAGVVYVGFTQLLHWDWRAALMFSVLIAATDPVSVIATMKEAKYHGRFRLLIEAESLLNDGTAAALFAVALLAIGTGTDLAEAILTFLKISIGGLGCGFVVGYLAIWLMGRTEDHLVELTCTVIAAFGSFLFAENLHFSGVLATLVAGIVVGNVGSLGALTAKGRDDAETFWEFAAFVSNSLLFLLMGARIAQTSYWSVLGAAVAAVLLVTVGRAASVYGVSSLFSLSIHRVERGHQHLLVWGGMRGALALALALGLPDTLPMRHEIVAVTFAVVAFSTLAQGMTMRPLMQRLLR